MVSTNAEEPDKTEKALPMACAPHWVTTIRGVDQLVKFKDCQCYF